MGTFSLEQKDNLVWLGRYTERVFTTIKFYFTGYDRMIDTDTHYYAEFCEKLDIPNIYQSKEDFLARYPFAEENSDSIYSNLIRAYNNGIVLREEIGSEALAYIQLAIYGMQKASVSAAPLIELQKVMDNLLAFWGAIDDGIENEHVRNLIKCGKRIERLDLYSRLEMPVLMMQKEVSRLAHRIKTTGVNYEKTVMSQLGSMMSADTLDYDKVVREIEKLAV